MLKILVLTSQSPEAIRKNVGAALFLVHVVEVIGLTSVGVQGDAWSVEDLQGFITVAMDALERLVEGGETGLLGEKGLEASA